MILLLLNVVVFRGSTVVSEELPKSAGFYKHGESFHPNPARVPFAEIQQFVAHTRVPDRRG